MTASESPKSEKEGVGEDLNSVYSKMINDEEALDEMKELSEDLVEHYLKWNDRINLTFSAPNFDEKTEEVKIYHPFYSNQVIPRSIDDGLLSIDGESPVSVDIDFNLETLVSKVNISAAAASSSCSVQLENHIRSFLPNTESVELSSSIFDMQNIGGDYFMSCTSSSCQKISSVHSSLNLITLFYIDAASFIEFDDDKWDIFYLFKQNKERSKTMLIGFCTVYKFWYFPDKIRPRISQFVILPPFRRNKRGTLFLYRILKYYQNQSSNVYDITVEDPNEEFTNMLDSIDLFQCLNKYTETSYQPALAIYDSLYDYAHNILKINQKRLYFICEMIALLRIDMTDEKQMKGWFDDLHERVRRPFVKQLQTAKASNETFSRDIKIQLIEDACDSLRLVSEINQSAFEEYQSIIQKALELKNILC